MLSTVAIFSKENNPKTTEGVKRLISEFCKRGIKTQLYHKSIDEASCPGGETF